MTCHHCSAEIDTGPRVGFRDACARCGRDLHVCLNCDFYDRGAYNECREPAAERVVDKERFNRCEYFRPGARAAGAAGPSKDDLRAAAEALFKRKAPPS